MNLQVRPRQRKPPQPVHTPGDLRLPAIDFSLTISKTGGNVSLKICNHIQEFMNNYCLKGAVATEVGQRAFNLRLQTIEKRDRRRIDRLVVLVERELLE
jgi:hypothetical protein